MFIQPNSNQSNLTSCSHLLLQPKQMELSKGWTDRGDSSQVLTVLLEGGSSLGAQGKPEKVVSPPPRAEKKKLPWSKGQPEKKCFASCKSWKEEVALERRPTWKKLFCLFQQLKGQSTPGTQGHPEKKFSFPPSHLKRKRLGIPQGIPPLLSDPTLFWINLQHQYNKWNNCQNCWFFIHISKFGKSKA